MTIREIKKKALLSLEGRWGTAIGVSLIVNLVSSAGSLFSIFSPSEELSDPAFWVFLIMYLMLASLISAATLLLVGALNLGYSQFMLNLVDGKEVRFSDLFSHFKRFGRSLLYTLWQSLFLFLWMLPMFGVLLLGMAMLIGLQISGQYMAADWMVFVQAFVITFVSVLVGMIPLIIATYRYALMPFLMVEYPKMGAPEAMRMSIGLMNGNKRRIFALSLSFFGWSLLSLLSLGIVNIWLMPYMNASYAVFYRDIITRWKESLKPVPPQTNAPNIQ